MRVNGDFYCGKAEIEAIIEGLIALKEKIEAIEDATVIDEAVDTLYEVIENGEE